MDTGLGLGLDGRQGWAFSIGGGARWDIGNPGGEHLGFCITNNLATPQCPVPGSIKHFSRDPVDEPDFHTNKGRSNFQIIADMLR